MSEIKHLLAAALDEEPTQMTTTTPAPPVDPTDDLARGRRSLYRRRTALIGGVAVAALAVGGGVPFALRHDSTSSPATTAAAPAPKAVEQQVTLVAYTGAQPKGYRVQWVPDGWVIQGSSESYLTIAPRGAADKDPSSFRDKLTVLSASSDTPKSDLTEGTRVDVAGRPGYLRRPPGETTEIFTYQDVSGRWVQIQVPDSLRWAGPQIARFAAGVQVINGAGDSHG